MYVFYSFHQIRYRGSAREALYRENQVLRERIDRVTRENINLHQEIRKERIKSSKQRQSSACMKFH